MTSLPFSFSVIFIVIYHSYPGSENDNFFVVDPLKTNMKKQIQKHKKPLLPWFCFMNLTDGAL